MVKQVDNGIIEENSENGPPNAEFLWVQFSERASSGFERGRFPEAGKLWKKAYGVAQDFDERDPRVASSLNNFAITLRITRDFEKAEGLYRRAMEGWKASSGWVARMRLVQRARSSLFHLRMEGKHREQYNRIATRQYQKLLPAGHAGTLNNLAELFHATNRLKDAEHLYDQALRERMDSMGEQDSGVAVIRKNIASLSDLDAEIPDSSFPTSQESSDSSSFRSRAEQQGWIVDQPPEFTDEGRLMAAILLTRLLSH